MSFFFFFVTLAQLHFVKLSFYPVTAVAFFLSFEVVAARDSFLGDCVLRIILRA